MDDRRMRPADVLAFTAALVSLAALWLPWFSYRPLGTRHDVHANAWQMFGGMDVALAAAAAIIAIALLWADVHLEVAAQVAAWGGAAIASEVIWKLLNPPFVGTDATPQVGTWVALVASVAICAGGTAATSSSARRRSRAGAQQLRAGYR
jgi:hypothetical protein